MKKIVIAVDDTKGTKSALGLFSEFCCSMKPDNVLLVFVEKFEGRSLMDDMLGDSELSTLAEVLEGSEYQRALDDKAKSILDYYQKALKENGVKGIKPVIRKGHPADEILKVAKEEKADMIIIGSRGKRISNVFMGSVSREVVNRSEIPVLIVK